MESPRLPGGFLNLIAMYLISTILPEFKNLIGWRESTDPDFESLPDFLKASSSGLYGNDSHALVTPENIKANSRVIDTTNYKAYDAGATYSEGQYVYQTPYLYRSLQNSNTGHLLTETDWWEKTTPLGEAIRDITNVSITQMISDIVSFKEFNAAARTLVDQKYLFHAAGRLADAIEKGSRVVGFEITIPRIPEIILEINKLGLQFTEAQTDLKIYIFHSSQEDPIHTFTVSTSNGRTFEWVSITDKVLKYVDTYDTGTFYIVYFEDDISGQSIRKIKDWSKGPCTSCGRADLEAYNAYSKFMTIHPFRVSSNNLAAGYNGHTGDFDAERKIWDLEKMEYMYQYNYGLNMQLSIKCDLTDFLVDNKAMFARLLQQKIAITTLERIAFNQHQNINRQQEYITPSTIQYILDGPHGNAGLKGEYSKSIKNMDINLSGFDPLCLPCKKKAVRYTSIG